MGRTASLLNSDVSKVILEHSCFTKHKQELFCLLLCTSKSMAAALAANCVGCVEVAAILDSEHDVVSFASWLDKHGMLVKSLGLCMGHLSPEQQSQAGTAVAVALQQAAKITSAGLQPQRVSCPYPFPALPAVLMQLPSSTLTSLHVRCKAGQIMDRSTGLALAHLSNLHSLTIGRRVYSHRRRPVTTVGAPIDPLLCHLAHLRQLVELVVDEGSWVQNTLHLQRLPQQLQSLSLTLYDNDGHVGGDSDDISGVLLLGHLTGLKQLTVEDDSNLVDEDILPTNLEQLRTFDATWRLDGLKRLQQLHLAGTKYLSQENLKRLTMLEALTSLSLVYEVRGDDVEDDSTSYALRSAPAWAFLPVTDLMITGMGHTVLLSDSRAQHLSTLTQVTSLSLESVQVRCKQFCSSVRYLTALRELELLAFDVHVPEGEASEADPPYALQQEQVMAAIATLPQLSRLVLNDIKFDLPLAELHAATNLTSLALSKCAASDFAFNSIMCSVKGLARLEISHCHALTAGIVPVIDSLKQLTYLSVANTLSPFVVQTAAELRPGRGPSGHNLV